MWGYNRPIKKDEQVIMQFARELWATLAMDENEDGFRKLETITNALGEDLAIPNIVEYTSTSSLERVNIFPASMAIMNGKLKFFEFILDKCPQIICAHYFCSTAEIYPENYTFQPISSSQRIIVESPLRVVMIKREPDIAKIVLRNKHCIDHAFNNSKEHKEHLEHCLGKAQEWYTKSMTNNEKTIIRMIKEVKGVRAPIISTMKSAAASGNLSQFTTILSSESFINFGFKSPDTCKAIIEDCIGCAERLCGSQPKISFTLKNVLNYKLFILAAMKEAVDTKDLSKFTTIIASLDFIDFGLESPEAHKAIVEDCIKCARKWCESQPEILEGLQRALA
jgi:hypothetical protein